MASARKTNHNGATVESFRLPNRGGRVTAGRLGARPSARRFQVKASGGWLQAGGGNVSDTAFQAVGPVSDPQRNEPWTYANVDRIVKAARVVPLVAMSGEGESAKVVTEGPLAELLKLPNPWPDSRAQTIRQLTARILRGLLRPGGEVFLVLTDKKGAPISTQGSGPRAPIEVPAQVWPVIGGKRMVRAIPDPKSGVTIGWEMNTRQGLKTYAAGSVIHLYLDADDDGRGFSPTDAAYSKANQLHLAGRFQDSLLRTGGDPGGVIEIPEILDSDERDRLREEIEDQWDDPDRAGETRLLEGGAKYMANKIGPKDMDFPTLVEKNQKTISAVYGVPDALLGMGTSNFATFEGELRVFWTLTIIPVLTWLEDLWNSQFVSRLTNAGAERVAYDLSVVRVLQGNLSEQTAVARNLTRIGVPLNTALERAGIAIDGIKGGEVPMVASGLVPLEAAAAGANLKTPPAKPGGAPTAAGEEGEPSPVEPTGETDSEKAADPKVTLNGAQITSLVDIVAKLSNGELVMETAIELVVAAYPFDRARASAILKDAEKGDTPTPPPSPFGMPAPVVDDDDKEDEEKKARGVHGPLTKILASGDPGATREGRVAALRAIERTLKKPEAKLERKVSSVFSRMRNAQLKRLRMVRDGESVDGRGLSPVELPLLSGRGLDLLATALEADLRSATRGEALRKAQQGRGAQVSRWLHARPSVEAWLLGTLPPVIASAYVLDPVHPGLQRLFDAARLKAAGLTPEEIDHLIAVTESQFADELEKWLADATTTTFRLADDQIRAEIAHGFFGPPDEALIQALKDKPILVAEGIQSTVATRTRATIIEVLTETTTVGTLQARLLADFEKLSAELKRDFNMHAARARTIARTEVGQIAGTVRHARLDEAMATGALKSRRWATSLPQGAAPPYESGGFVRFEHWSMDGKTAKRGELWTLPDGTRMPHPRFNGGPAHQVINCGCQELGVVNDALEDPDAPEELFFDDEGATVPSAKDTGGQATNPEKFVDTDFGPRPAAWKAQKTTEDVEAWLKSGNLVTKANLAGMDAATANEASRAVFDVIGKHGKAPLDLLETGPMNKSSWWAYAQTHYDLASASKLFRDPTLKGLKPWRSQTLRVRSGLSDVELRESLKVTEARYATSNARHAERVSLYEKSIADIKAKKLTADPLDTELRALLDENLAHFQGGLKQLKSAPKFDRHNVGDGMYDLVSHELGHILHGRMPKGEGRQFIGQTAVGDIAPQGLARFYKRLGGARARNLKSVRDGTMSKAARERFGQTLSEYSTTNTHELLAEAFAAYQRGGASRKALHPDLVSVIEELLETVL